VLQAGSGFKAHSGVLHVISGLDISVTVLFFRVLMPRRLRGLKMETVCFSKMLVSAYESTRRHNPEQHCHPHCCENSKSHIGISMFRVKFNLCCLSTTTA
jgi:hypothetical protein